MKNKTARQFCGAVVFAFAACALGGYSVSGMSPAVAVLLLSGVTLEPMFALLAAGLYLFAGLWLPVYPGLASGYGVLLGRGGGFLLSLLLCAFVVAATRKGIRRYPYLATFVGLCAAFLLFFGVGVIWQVVRTGAGFSAVLQEQFGRRFFLFGLDALLALLASPNLHRAV